MEVQALGNGTFGDLLNKTPRSHAIPGNLAGVSEAKVRIGNRSMTTYLVKFQDSLPQRSIFNLSYWVDPDSGLIVKATEEGPFPALYFNCLYDNFTLKSTNIISLSGSSDLFIVAIGVAAATAAIAIMPVIYMQRSGSHKKTEDTGDQEDLPEGSISGESRIEELDALPEKGVIEKEFYDESVRRLRRRRKFNLPGMTPAQLYLLCLLFQVARVLFSDFPH